MTLIAVARLHHASAAIGVRERFTEAAAGLAPSRDAIALLTCHRAEVYAAVQGDTDPRAFFEERLGPLPPELHLETGADACAHLFRVAAGLDSAIQGERQILGQVRLTYDRSRAEAPGGPLALLFERALHVGRDLRATTPLGQAGASLGSLAVAAALERLASPATATVLVLGAGEMGKLAARSLSRRVGTLLVANRDAERARAVAADALGTALPLDDAVAALGRADAVISAADTRGAVLTAGALAPHAPRGLVVVDIAMPRSVAPEARALPGLCYLTVDDLVPPERALDPDLARACEERCLAEAGAVVRALDARAVADTIALLRERAEDLRRRQLARALARLGHLSQRDRNVVEALSLSLTSALLHEPTAALRGSPERAPAARELFRL